MLACTLVCSVHLPGEPRVPCAKPPSQPSIVTHHAVTIRHVLSVLILACLPHVTSTNIARAAPNPDHTLFSRLCLSACTCHGSLWGTAQTACSALSPAPCFPCDQEHLHIHWSCDLESVCLMCLLLPTVHILSSGWIRRLWWSLPTDTCSPAWQVAVSCISIALLFSCLKK